MSSYGRKRKSGWVGAVLAVLVVAALVGALGWLSKGFQDWNAGTWFDGWFHNEEQTETDSSIGGREITALSGPLQLSSMSVETDYDVALYFNNNGGGSVNYGFSVADLSGKGFDDLSVEIQISGQFLRSDNGQMIDSYILLYPDAYDGGYVYSFFGSVPKSNNKGGYSISFIDGNVYTFGADITDWAGDGEPVGYTETLTYVSELSLPPDPTIPHYDFVGWYLDAELSVPYQGQTITSNMTFYAKFVLTTYHIYFVTGFADVSAPAAVSVTALTAGGSMPSLSHVGYTFEGWYTDTARTIPYSSTAEMTGNMVLYAKWEQSFVTVTFMVDGSVYATVQVPYGSSLSAAQAQAGLQGFSVISFSLADLSAPNVVDNVIVLNTDATIYAESMTPIQKVGSVITEHWRVLLGGILSVAVVFGVVSVFTRGKRHSKRRY
ncbi:hypothetical protein FACS1894211_12810 [Clostridia bacterium]|nr:hypothetical protein FACS1894211_12810 [Clostridia bacterium]